MKSYTLKAGKNYSEIVQQCVDALLKPGAVLLLPTETVYGLVCRWSDDDAKKRIFRIKGRNENKPFQMMISSTEQLKEFGVNIFSKAEKLTNTFCPGPITILIPHNGAKIGYRIPDHPFFLDILSVIGEPLAATSANLSGAPVTLSVSAAIEQLREAVDVVVDAGELPADVMASTVVDLTEDSFSIIRKGPISEQHINDVLH